MPGVSRLTALSRPIRRQRGVTLCLPPHATRRMPTIQVVEGPRRATLPLCVTRRGRPPIRGPSRPQKRYVTSSNYRTASPQEHLFARNGDCAAQRPRVPVLTKPLRGRRPPAASPHQTADCITLYLRSTTPPRMSADEAAAGAKAVGGMPPPQGNRRIADDREIYLAATKRSGHRENPRRHRTVTGSHWRRGRL